MERIHRFLNTDGQRVTVTNDQDKMAKSFSGQNVRWWQSTFTDRNGKLAGSTVITMATTWINRFPRNWKNSVNYYCCSARWMRWWRRRVADNTKRLKSVHTLYLEISLLLITSVEKNHWCAKKWRHITVHHSAVWYWKNWNKGFATLNIVHPQAGIVYSLKLSYRFIFMYMENVCDILFAKWTN